MSTAFDYSIHLYIESPLYRTVLLYDGPQQPSPQHLTPLSGSSMAIQATTETPFPRSAAGTVQENFIFLYI